MQHEFAPRAQEEQPVDAPPVPVHDLGAARRDPRRRGAHRQRVDLARAAQVEQHLAGRGVRRQVLYEYRGVVLFRDVRALVVRVRRVAPVVGRCALLWPVLSC